MKTKNLFLIVVILLIFNACKKDKEIPALPPPAEVQYQSIDSMKLNSQSASFIDAATYNQVNNKQYIVNSTKVEMRFSNNTDNNEFVIFISEKTNPNQETGLYISLKNKNINNIDGTYSLVGNDICIEWVQDLEQTSTGSFFVRTVPATCEQIITGNITIQYDASTNTISGKIEKLKYSFSEYLPFYVNGYRPPSPLSVWLKASGSSRNQDILFRYVK